MSNSLKKPFKNLMWCIPVLIMTLCSVYYMNLFENIKIRDLDRQLSEKHKFMEYIININNEEQFGNAIKTLYSFEDIYTYVLDENLDRVAEKQYNQKHSCDFILPYENERIRSILIISEKGTFEYDIKPNVYMYWEYRWVNVNNTKYLIIIGIKNYPFDKLDTELQVSIGLLLLLTAILNWILVGYAKYLYQKNQCCKLFVKEK